MDNEKKLKQRAKLWGGLALFIILVVLGITNSVQKNNVDNTQNNTQTLDLQISENDWIKGDLNAPLVLVEYADFECPACASYHDLLNDMKNKYDKDLAIVFRHFPLSQIHKNAFLASMASEAAGIQGKFWEMHDMIFENQDIWSKKNNAKEIFVQYAKDLGLDQDKFIQDIENKDLKEKISQSYDFGSSININGTPTFFLNGKKIPNPRSNEEFDLVLSNELNI